MEFGKWELRDNNYTGYYFSKDSMIYPSSNSVDSGKIHTEENVRNIYRDLTKKNFVTKHNYFSLSINDTRDAIIVSPGEAVIQGYHFYAKNSIEVKVPNDTIYDEDGSYNENIQSINQYTLGISLTYDAANHVTGDVVNKEAPVGESEVLSGVYVTWFTECQLEHNYENILVLGRAWVQAGKIVIDNTTDANGETILHGFEIDPFKDHVFEAKSVEVEIEGQNINEYDTLAENITQIYGGSLCSYESMRFQIEHDIQNMSKPPSFVTDIQDYVYYMPKWYISKYGDHVTGALRFNNLSSDAIEKLKNINPATFENDYTNTNGFADGVFISPRTYSDLSRYIVDGEKITEKSINTTDYDVGGTIMSIVPTTYPNGTDYNNGYTGIHAALVSQKYGETGLRIHYGEGEEINGYNTTRIVHYNEKDNGQIYKNLSSSVKNTSNFIIENIDGEGKKSSIDMKNGEIFIDSYGSGIQLYTSSKELSNNIDFRVDETEISVAAHNYDYHRTGERSDAHFKVGLGITYDTYVTNAKGEVTRNNTTCIQKYSTDKLYDANTDPYLSLGNLRIRSNSIPTLSESIKQNTIEILNNSELPFITVRPRIYSEQYVAEELIQVGSSKYNDLKGNNAQNNTKNRIIIKKVGLNDLSNFDSNSLTYFEHNYKDENDKSAVLNKMMPKISNSLNEIAGIYSSGNIGCSTKTITSSTTTKTYVEAEDNQVYTNNADWVRFTKYGYVDEYVDNGKKYKETDSYNIEFNTSIDTQNTKVNQIIWNHPNNVSYGPMILSHIVNAEINSYTSSSIHNCLMLENASFIVSDKSDISDNYIKMINGDISATGIITCYNITATGGNDFAETFEKDNKDEFAKPGTLIALNPDTTKYTICEGFENKMVVGIQSNSYAYLAGGNINNTQDSNKLEDEYFTVAVSGKVWVNVVENSNINPGDMLVSSFEKGKATKSIQHIPGTIIGKALSKPKYFEEDKEYKVLVLVMTA